MEEVKLKDQKPVKDLLDELLQLTSLNQEDANMAELKYSMKTNPYHQAVMECLTLKKEKTALSTIMIKNDTDQENQDGTDNLLRSGGITGPDISMVLSQDVVGSEQEEYREQLRNVRKNFETNMRTWDFESHKFSENVRTVLSMQAEFRPVSAMSIQKMIEVIMNKLHQIPKVLKQSACEAVISLRKKYLDARRKRRNFSKSSTEILNEYFINNLEHPYPSEEVKQVLAAKCNISVAQVSNWFGNKRIRYKKTMAKEKESKNEVQRQAVAAMAANPYGLIPNAFGGMMNPYQMMMPGGQNLPLGVPPFQFPVYNPEMMAQYQQSMQQNTNQSS